MNSDQIRPEGKEKRKRRWRCRRWSSSAYDIGSS